MSCDGNQVQDPIPLDEIRESFVPLDGADGDGAPVLLAIVNVMTPGMGPSVWSMALLKVSMASAFDWFKSDTPFTFRS